MSKVQWTPPRDIVREIMDCAGHRISEGAIIRADESFRDKELEPLRNLLDGMLAFADKRDQMEKDQVFACLKAALIEAKAEEEARKQVRKAWESEERRAKEKLEDLRQVASEMLDAYGYGPEGAGRKLTTPMGDIRYQKNSQPFVWVDEEKIDEIPISIPGEGGEVVLVKVEKTPLKAGIASYLEDLEEQGLPKPAWAEIREPGYHLRF